MINYVTKLAHKDKRVVTAQGGDSNQSTNTSLSLKQLAKRHHIHFRSPAINFEGQSQ